MTYTQKHVRIPGISMSGIGVSVEPRGWRSERQDVRVLDAFPTVDGTGVSAGGRRT